MGVYCLMVRDVFQRGGHFFVDGVFWLDILDRSKGGNDMTNERPALYRVRYICPKTDEIFTLTVWAQCDVVA